METTEFITDDVEDAEWALRIFLLVEECGVEPEGERHLVNLVKVGLNNVSVECKEHVENLLILLVD